MKAKNNNDNRENIYLIRINISNMTSPINMDYSVDFFIIISFYLFKNSCCLLRNNKYALMKNYMQRPVNNKQKVILRGIQKEFHPTKFV